MNSQTKKDIKEALVYAVLNGVAAASVYIGATIFAGGGAAAAAVSGAALGLAMFGSYLVREMDEVNLDAPGIGNVVGGAKDRTKKTLTGFLVPESVRRHGLFRVF